MAPRRAAWLVALAALAAAGCVRLARRIPPTRETRQRENARVVQPAEIRAAPGGGRDAEVRVLRVRAWADQDFRAEEPDWAAAIERQLQRASEVLEPQLGIRLVLESARPWERSAPGAPLQPRVVELFQLDRGEGVDWVIGWVGPIDEDGRSLRRELLGAARVFGRHLVLRAMESPADRVALASWDALADEERTAMAGRWKRHRELSTLLHEWAHTLGAVHECQGKSLMSREYSLLESAFSPDAIRLVRLGLRLREAQGAAAIRALAEAYRAEAARITAEVWDCPELERDLARNQELLAAAAARAR